MRRVFADAFFYIAVLNRNDAAHRSSLEIIAGGSLEIVTTTAILLEVADAMSAPARRRQCGRFLAELARQPHTAVHEIDGDLFARGLALYRDRPDKEWSLTDCLSFVVMAADGLTDALTGDRHFEQAGFGALLAAACP